MSSIDAWNILVLAPFPIYTRWLYIETFIDNLLANGNSVTVISPYDYSKVNEKYYSLIVPEFPIDDYCEWFWTVIKYFKELNPL